MRAGWKLLLTCRSCGKKFVWVTPEHWWEQIPVYCTPGHAQRARRRRNNAETYTKCPRPDKILYRDHEAAQKDARKLSREQGRLLVPYRCVCGGLHNGNLLFTVIR